MREPWECGGLTPRWPTRSVSFEVARFCIRPKGAVLSQPRATPSLFHTTSLPRAPSTMTLSQSDFCPCALYPCEKASVESTRFFTRIKSTRTRPEQQPSGPMISDRGNAAFLRALCGLLFEIRFEQKAAKNGRQVVWNNGACGPGFHLSVVCLFSI